MDKSTIKPRFNFGDKVYWYEDWHENDPRILSGEVEGIKRDKERKTFDIKVDGRDWEWERDYYETYEDAKMAYLESETAAYEEKISLIKALKEEG